eukprot:15438498-Alexandrium_andersonii.AAC.1
MLRRVRMVSESEPFPCPPRESLSQNVVGVKLRLYSLIPWPMPVWAHVQGACGLCGLMCGIGRRGRVCASTCASSPAWKKGNVMFCRSRCAAIQETKHPHDLAM